jgi:hypothetical protein
MSRNDITIKDIAGYSNVPTRVFQVASGAAASIKAGEPVVLATIGTNVAVALGADADPTIGTDYLAGIAAQDSTDTVAAAGFCEVYLPMPGITYRGKAKSSTAADTNAEILALAMKRGIFDLTAGAWTLDTAAADGATNGLIYTGTGNADANQVDFQISVRATILGF